MAGCGDSGFVDYDEIAEFLNGAYTSFSMCIYRLSKINGSDIYIIMRGRYYYTQCRYYAGCRQFDSFELN